MGRNERTIHVKKQLNYPAAVLLADQDKKVPHAAGNPVTVPLSDAVRSV